jgi:TetR/AcrR family transcriptional regulator, cholesterol catabolism regulator
VTREIGGRYRNLAPNGSDTAQRLLQSAARLFWQNGYAATSVRELSAHLGIQKASLYHHIQSKEDLLYELCVISLEDIDAQARAAVDAEHDPLLRLRALILAHVNSMSQDREMHATMLTELRSLSPEHRRDVIRRRDAYERLVQSVLETCQEAGSIRADISARLLARCLLNLLNWSIFWFNPGGKMSTQELAGVLVSIFFEGTLPSFLDGGRTPRKPLKIIDPN